MCRELTAVPFHTHLLFDGAAALVKQFQITLPCMFWLHTVINLAV